jgi:hypothetical protein
VALSESHISTPETGWLWRRESRIRTVARVPRARGKVCEDEKILCERRNAPKLGVNRCLPLKNDRIEKARGSSDKDVH